MSKHLNGLIFQLSAISMLLIQALIAPLIIGIDSYGQQVLLLLPVFLAQAVIEPAFQAQLNEQSEELGDSLDIGSAIVLLVFATIIFVATKTILGHAFDGLTISILSLFFLNTAFQARAFASSRFSLAAIASPAMLLGYIVGFLFGVLVWKEAELLIANLFGFGCSAFVFLNVFLREPLPAIRWSLPSRTSLWGGLSFRLPTLTVTTVFLILLSKFGISDSMIGSIRIFISAIGAGKYANLVSVPHLQIAIRKIFLSSDAVESWRSIYIYLLCFCLFLILSSVFLPTLFMIVFHQSSFGMTEVFMGGFILLIQPLSYSIYEIRKLAASSVTVLFLVTSFLTLGFFSIGLWFGTSPFFLFGFAAICTAFSLCLILWRSYRVARATGVSS